MHNTTLSTLFTDPALVTQLQTILATTYPPTLHVVPYSPPPHHRQRLKHIYATHPALCIPREEWTSHENWSLNKQMTQYHMPIRRVLHKVICGICEGYETQQHSLVNTTIDDAITHTVELPFRQTLSTAHTQFQQLVWILEGHAEREETHLFRRMAEVFPGIDFTTMYTAHRAIDTCIERVHEQFRWILQHQSPPRTNSNPHTNSNPRTTGMEPMVKPLLTALLALHTHLIDHLNEEEDILVPMSLVQPDAMHRQWPFSPDLEDDASVVGHPRIRHRL